MKNIENYFDLLPYNGNLVRNSNKSGSTQIGPEEYSNPEPPVDKHTYFYIENISNESATFTITNNKSSGAAFTSIEISEDGETWVPLELDNDTYSFEVTDKTYLRAVQTSWNYWTINSNKDFNVGGNIMSLLYSDNFEDKTSFPEGSEYTFGHLFEDAPSLVSAKDLILPATTLTEECYSFMFAGCTSLTEAPQLPATTLANDCYQAMFSACTALTEAPQLPATTLVGQCYEYMFQGCTLLNEITIYANDNSAKGCLDSWLDNVAEDGYFHNLGTAYFRRRVNCPTNWVADHPEYITDK